MSALLVLILAQTAAPQPRVERSSTEVCVVEPLAEGGEARHCRARDADYSGGVLDAPSLGQKVEVPVNERPTHFGFAMALGGGVPVIDGGNTSGTVHGRFGVRYAFLDREQNPGRLNLAVALLGGGDVDGSRAGAGFEARIEATVGGHRRWLEPTLDVFVAAGVQHLDASMKPEWHIGGGVSLDLVFSRLFDSPANDNAGTVLLPFAVAPQFAIAALFVLSPTAELRYVTRADGSSYGELVVGIGL